MQDVFDLRNTDLSEYVDDLSFDLERFMRIREKFGEILDTLKKEKLIKSSLELCILTSHTESSELKDWLIVSEQGLYTEQENKEVLGKFVLDSQNTKDEFVIVRASGYKCPRCWQFVSQEQDTPCVRCQEVIRDFC